MDEVDGMAGSEDRGGVQVGYKFLILCQISLYSEVFLIAVILGMILLSFVIVSCDV